MPTRAQMSEVHSQVGGHTQLMRAALAGDLKSVKTLLKCGADPNERNDDGRTALMFAAINRETSCAKELLRHGAEVNAVANDGGTALLLAASEGDAELVRVLLDKGANVSARFNETENTALKLARERGYADVVSLLETAETSRQSPDRHEIKEPRSRNMRTSDKHSGTQRW